MPLATISSFNYRDYSLEALAAAKGERTISVCIPARNEESTIGKIVATIVAELVENWALVDEVILIDDHSSDATAAVAANAGATVVSAEDILPEQNLGPGKGQAMWKSLLVSSGDLITWCDGDIREFEIRFVVGILGPLLTEADLQFVKAYYERPYLDEASGGGRVTEIMARPLISLLFPHLAGLYQPLSGEYGGYRSLLEQLPFVADYGVELGLLIDVANLVGTDAIGQVDLGERQHRNRPLDDLGPQAATILHTALVRVNSSLVSEQVEFVRPAQDSLTLDHLELPPMASLAPYQQRHSPT